MRRLVIHVPHASTYIPEDVWPEFLIDRRQVDLEASVSADLFTELMAREAWPEAEIVEPAVSRIVVDVERYDDDQKEEMAAVGRGAIYTHDHRQVRIRRDLPQHRRAELLADYYAPHWSRLREAARGATLVDLHTYPKDPWPIERYVGADRPEIDIGFAAGLTSTTWVASLTEHFSAAGYEVGHNSPYSGVIDAGAVQAVMIEIRRDVGGTPGDDPSWRRLIAALMSMPIKQ